MRAMTAGALAILFVLVGFDSARQASSIEGAWELVRGEYVELDGTSSTLTTGGRASQVKIFTPTHFAYLMDDPDGNFMEASAGRYRIEGDQYIETFDWTSNPPYRGLVATWQFRIDGDTLHMTGPTRVVQPDGGEWSELPRYTEARVRARR
jgi:hypothetical protein